MMPLQQTAVPQGNRIESRCRLGGAHTARRQKVDGRIMTLETNWPFDQPMDATAVVDLDVMEGRVPVLLVVHYSEDKSWAFLSGGPFDPERAGIASMSEAVALDGSLRMIADLPPGWTATRIRVGDPWVRQRDPEV
jgi:hypothetical protein